VTRVAGYWRTTEAAERPLVERRLSETESTDGSRLSDFTPLVLHSEKCCDAKRRHRHQPCEAAESLQTSLRPKYPDHIADSVRELLAGRGFSDDEISEALSQMPRSAIEGGMGGETDDRRRGGRDRRRGAMDAAASFDAFYPWAKNIKPATSFR
jgi:hypothetical protein